MVSWCLLGVAERGTLMAVTNQYLWGDDGIYLISPSTYPHREGKPFCCFSNHLQSSMPSKQPRTPEVEVSEDSDSGFKASIYDGEYLIQVRPHENGYQLSLASKTGMGDAAFL